MIEKKVKFTKNEKNYLINNYIKIEDIEKISINDVANENEDNHFNRIVNKLKNQIDKLQEDYLFGYEPMSFFIEMYNLSREGIENYKIHKNEYEILNSIVDKLEDTIEELREELKDYEKYLDYADLMNFRQDKLGAIIGDIIGSRFEFNNIKSKNFELFTNECFVTDDSIMTLAIADAIIDCKGNYKDLRMKTIKSMKEIGRNYLDCGYGNRFFEWIFSDDTKPYNSFGNGAAMRVSACGWYSNSLLQAQELARKVTEITHNHPEGIKGAQAVASAIFLARMHRGKYTIKNEEHKGIEDIKNYICDNYYNIDFALDEIRPIYMFNETCQETVPQALEAFFESITFEDAIRNAISIGGDSDTLAAIAGSVAGAYYGIPKEIYNKAKTYLDDRLIKIVYKFAKSMV